MAKIVEGPVYKRVKCHDCQATIEYLPEDVEIVYGSQRVKCPRVGERKGSTLPTCPGWGYVTLRDNL